ncbi:MAG TPA: hypothetical protein PK504_07360 [Ferruginibacter sp.]|nr:hypothetical protein [Ferruginibacter sp.]HRE65174.1 hypothetical protein [Ferruginibacter sp.]
MKKIFLSALVLIIGFTAVQAQTKKKKSKLKPLTADQKQQAEVAKITKEKQAKFEEARLARLEEDSIRKETEIREEFVKDSLRQDWKAKKISELDSTNKSNWTKTVVDKDAWYNHDRSQNAINKSAGLNDVQGRKVKAINDEFNIRAKDIKADETFTDDVKKTQLTALNTERLTKIKELVGKNKAKDLEKARKNYGKKNTDDIDSKWIEEAGAPAKKKK